MTKTHDNKSNQEIRKESKTSRARMKDSKTAIIFFLVLIIAALLACLAAEHMGYMQIKQHDDTSSADDLNGQNPANTYTTPAAATNPSAPTTATTPAANSTAPATTAPTATTPTSTTPTATPATTNPMTSAPPATGNTPASGAPPSQNGNQDSTNGNTQR